MYSADRYRGAPLRLWLVALIATSSACSSHLMPVVSANDFRNIAPISKSVLLLMPEEFAGHVYTGGPDQRKVSVKFGESTSELLPTLLDRIFTTVEVREVDAAAAALPNSAAAGGRDYVAIPKFVRTSSSLTDGAVTIETALSVAFAAADGSRTITAAGSGKGTTHIWSQASLQTTAGIALRTALESLVADINTKRQGF
jgi:hypothetical protein